MELKITDGNFEEEVKKSSIPVLVDFYADWRSEERRVGKECM